MCMCLHKGERESYWDSVPVITVIEYIRRWYNLCFLERGKKRKNIHASHNLISSQGSENCSHLLTVNGYEVSSFDHGLLITARLELHGV